LLLLSIDGCQRGGENEFLFLFLHVIITPCGSLSSSRVCKKQKKKKKKNQERTFVNTFLLDAAKKFGCAINAREEVAIFLCI